MVCLFMKVRILSAFVLFCYHNKARKKTAYAAFFLFFSVFVPLQETVDPIGGDQKILKGRIMI